ncbi:hypothetical protein HY212_01525 [Candidatus Pacearchaeota archaeon]|nr:hypothetical protein [Candidatus Pacearchaeota archaeon]
MNNKTSVTLLIAAFCMIIGITLTVSALISQSPYMIIGWIFMIISIIIFGFVKTSKKKDISKDKEPITQKQLDLVKDDFTSIKARIDELEKEVKELKTKK